MSDMGHGGEKDAAWCACVDAGADDPYCPLHGSDD
jgi:hypothetical protein